MPPQVPITRSLPSDKIVSVIVYTASLSSDVASIDPLLDTLRVITVNHQDGNFSEAELNQLHELQAELENYLVEKERVRSFDYNSLHQHIQMRFSGSSSLQRTNRLKVAGIFLLAVVLCAGFAAAPLHTASDLKGLIAITVLYSVILVGAAQLFIGALKELTPEARRAYRYISFSIVGMGTLVFLQPLLGILGLAKEPYAPTVFSAPVVGIFVLLYSGSRLVAGLVNVRGRLTSPRMVVGLACGVVALSVLLTLIVRQFHSTPLPALYSMSAVASSGLEALLLGASALILRAASKRQPQFYAQSTKGLLLPTMINAVLNCYFALYWLLIGNVNANSWLYAGLVVLLVVGCLYVRAGYLFNNIHRN